MDIYLGIFIELVLLRRWFFSSVTENEKKTEDRDKIWVKRLDNVQYTVWDSNDKSWNFSETDKVKKKKITDQVWGQEIFFHSNGLKNKLRQISILS